MATIKDVAERAGVAPSTVSYVLSGSRKISDETRKAVRTAIAELGYHPRASARTLRSARSDVLVLAAPRLPGKYRAVDGRFAIEISDAARGHGYDVLMLTDPDGVAGLRRIAGSGLADAAVLMAVRQDDPRVSALRELGFPAALLGHGDELQERELPWVDLDWAAAVDLAVREAAAGGHRRIAFLASADREIDSRRGYALHGLAGAERAARHSGAEVTIHPTPSDPERLRALLRRMLASPSPGGPAPTALVMQYVLLLPVVLNEVAALGLRVPGELTVLPVGTLPEDPSLRALPRIDLPVGRMSAAVVQLAVDAVASRRSSPGVAGERPEPGHELIPPRFAEGPSVAPPPARAHAP
ncbi:LacI family DNA-binding transcriptional regulator [Streptomyces sp. 6N223]|uniref:LacI family DNA-binding transcriptional regulator n=1 Tax=Streptomyces sp. 6N223 TaxID=3457412 RepID=UPI003FD379BB